MATSAPSLAKATQTARPMPESPPVTRATRPASLPVPVYARISSCGSGVISDSTPGRSCCCVGNSFSSDPMAARLPGRARRLTVAAPPHDGRPLGEVALAPVQLLVLAEREVADHDGARAHGRQRAAAGVGHSPLRATGGGARITPADAEAARGGLREQAAAALARG